MYAYTHTHTSNARLPLTGFHDTSTEVFDPMAANFKNLRRQDLDGERRSEREIVSVYNERRCCC